METAPSKPWTPQRGPQLRAIEATWCDELFFGGARGGGKSDFLLGDFLQGVTEYKENWQGILFRRTFPELTELIKRSHKIYPDTGATWREGDKEWRWPNGAILRMRYLERVSDASRYQGHQYTWIGWDELTQWPGDEAYRMIKACLRWAEADVPEKRIRCSGNPGGPGHAWVKDYFIDWAPAGRVPKKDETTGMERMFIPSRVEDNKMLLRADPGYVDRLRGVGSPELVRAWLEGDWSAVVGAYFTEFRPDLHVVKPFKIPKHWLRFGSFDWGSSAPFVFGWYAVSDGNPIDNNTYFPTNAIIKYRELYGAEKPNVGLKLTAEQTAHLILGKQPKSEKVTYKIADPACFIRDGGPSIAERMHIKGVTMRPADNKRVPGWDQLRQRLVGIDGKPMLYFFSTCVHTIRTIPSLQHDERNPEDVDTNGDDHAGDETRYAVMSRPWVRSAPVEKPVKGHTEVSLDELWKLEKKFQNYKHLRE